MKITIHEATKTPITVKDDRPFLKEPSSVYVIDETRGLWRRVKPKAYQDHKMSSDHTIRGVYQTPENIFLFIRDTSLEKMLLAVCGPAPCCGAKKDPEKALDSSFDASYTECSEDETAIVA
jgi:hypothetical protein